MSNLLAPARVFVLFIVPVLFSLMAQAESDTLPKTEIEQAIRQQLDAAYELREWSHSLIKQVRKGPVSINQLALEVIVELKEPLYRRTGQQHDGKQLVRQTRPKGERIVLKGQAVVADTGGLGANQIQVVLSPGAENEAGLPLGSYPAGFVIVDNEAEAASLAPATPVNSQAKASKPALAGPVQQLLGMFGDQKAIWGEETWGAYKGSPVVLRALKQTGDHSLEGIIDYPNQGLSNPFVLMGPAGSLTLQIKPASPAGKGVPRTLYRVSLEDDQLVARRGPVIPLSRSKSELLRQTFERERAPWQFEGDKSDYAQLGNMLINVNTLERVSDGWGIQPLAQVTNLPGRFWPMQTNYQLTSAPFGAYRASDVHTEDPKRVSFNPLAGISAPTWVASDLSRYVSLKQGDVWAGTLDWQAGTASAPQNLTGIGVLNNLKPFAWCEQHVFFFNPQASDKPILRVNTQSGELKEMSESKALHHSAQGSPDGCFLFTSDGRMVHSAQGAKSNLYVADLRSLETFTLDASFDGRHYVGTQKQPALAQAIMVQSWVGRGLFWSSRQFGWFDLTNRKRISPHDFAGVVKDLPYSIRPLDMLPIPGDRHIEVSYTGFLQSTDAQKDKQIKKRYRLERVTGKAISLPLFGDVASRQGVVWVDENRYVYPIRKGGLNELGTWLYDIRSKKLTRLSHFYADEKIHAQNRAFASAAQAVWSTPLYHDASYLVLPDKNRILFSVMRGNLQELVSVSLDGKELARKPVPASGMTQSNAGFRLRRLHPYDISLPFVQRGAVQSARQ
ncbi:hypothetical protein DFR30_0934 [Thiogranum longum]|uniref:Uncharacterized protein n=1 Tax=Thiogranum longum TaxID=1537524 RepID=A0A4R1HB11_9GAMM|nr:hypothetical protein [Thiogranum longum]TCK17693.1 hypothetical protein DFR30_0934 [Thiogranum longum]